MKAIIIDDEKNTRIAIATMVNDSCDNITIIAEADSVKTGLEAIHKYNPDLIFLDIQMSDGSGFDLLKKIDNIAFKIIFITAHNKFAIKAFKYSAIDYLLKPVIRKELVEAVKRAQIIVDKNETDLKLTTLKTNSQSEEKKILLKTTDSIHIANLRDIVRCEADRNYTTIYLKDGKKIVMAKSLKEFDDMFSESGFFRIHHAHLINLSYLQKIKRSRGGEVVMKDNSILPVAVARKHDLMIMIETL